MKYSTDSSWIPLKGIGFLNTYLLPFATWKINKNAILSYALDAWNNIESCALCSSQKMHQVYDVEIGGRGIYKLLTGGNIK